MIYNFINGVYINKVFSLVCVTNMPSYPITRCEVCDGAVQLHVELQTASLMAGGSLPKTPFSTELDSNRFWAYCRGQGSFYGVEPADIYAAPKRFDTHFNFSGAYTGMCCYCALTRGYNMGSFISVGCYHCKRNEMLIKEFSKLKKRRGDVSSISWSTCGWGGLSDSVIDLILQMVVEKKPLLTFD
jgi:hypothetical protein